MISPLKIVVLTVGLSACLAANAQTVVSMSLAELDSLRNEIELRQAQNDSIAGVVAELQSHNSLLCARIDTMRREMGALKDEATALRHDTTTLKRNATALKSDAAALQATITRLREDSIPLSNTLREQVDEMAVKLANARLSLRYDAKLASNSLEMLRTITTESVKDRYPVDQLISLWQRYQSYSDEIKTVLQQAQSNPDRTKPFGNDNNKYTNYVKELLQGTTYYKEVYAKKGIWHIPYLDNIIDATKRALERHNPSNRAYVDFTVLIELL